MSAHIPRCGGGDSNFWTCSRKIPVAALVICCLPKPAEGGIRHVPVRYHGSYRIQDHRKGRVRQQIFDFEHDSCPAQTHIELSIIHPCPRGYCKNDSRASHGFYPLLSPYLPVPPTGNEFLPASNHVGPLSKVSPKLAGNFLNVV